MHDRLTKSDWIKAGLKTLARAGPAALKAGPLAAELKVSRGSFYWHFQDVGDFKAQLLRRWAEITTDQVRLDVEADRSEPDQLKGLLRRVFGDRRTLDRAIRSWAADDEGVAAIVAVVDASRLGYIEQLLIAGGVRSEQANLRAALLYWGVLGQAFVMDPRQSAISSSFIDEIADFFRA